VGCGEKLRRALEKHVEYLQRETLAESVEWKPLEAVTAGAEGTAGEEPFRLDFVEV
jgi:hypothetical protein